MHIIITIAFALIIASLASAVFFMMRDRGSTNRMAWSLTMRIGLSIALFGFILLANQLGWIRSTGTLY